MFAHHTLYLGFRVFGVYAFSKFGRVFFDLNFFVEKKIGEIRWLFFWRQAGIRLLSGLGLSDITYFSAFFGRVRQSGFYPAFVNLTEDKSLRGHVRNHHFCKKEIVRGLSVFTDLENVSPGYVLRL